MSRPARVARIETAPFVRNSGSPDVAARTGRADRNTTLMVRISSLPMSRPARVARIETPRTHHRQQPPWSRPARVARIETGPGRCRQRLARVAARTGRADRNSDEQAAMLDVLWSRPARVARIETRTALALGISHPVAARTGRADRNIAPGGMLTSNRVAARTGRADRNSASCCASTAWRGRGPHGSRG